MSHGPSRPVDGWERATVLYMSNPAASIPFLFPMRQRPAFPADRRAQAGCVLELLIRTPQDTSNIAARFKPQPDIERDIEELHVSLDRLGEIETFDKGCSYMRMA